jgi:formate/nitrite transporter FocA (FNT family)
MRQISLRTYRIMALFLLACLLFNYPLLALFNVGATSAGVPVLYIYLFSAWAFTIAIAAIVFEGGN